MLNSEFMQSMAEKLASRVSELTESDAESASKLIELTLNRKAESEEITELAKLISESSLKNAAAVILNTNEFIYVP
jgi:N-acetylglutamate synthase/N-acetylornithine aminotransferase